MIDLAVNDSFPASDPPAWTGAHAGAPLSSSRVSAETDLLYESVQRIRDDLYFLEAGDEASELVWTRFEEAGWPVKSRPTSPPPTNVEAVIMGTSSVEPGRAHESVVVCARLRSHRSVALLLAVARALRSSVLPPRAMKNNRTIRLAAYEDQPAYLDDLRRSGPTVSAIVRVELSGAPDAETIARVVPSLVDRILSLSRPELPFNNTR